MSARFISTNLVLLGALSVAGHLALAQAPEAVPRPPAVAPMIDSGPELAPPRRDAQLGVAMPAGHGSRQHTVYLRFDGNLTGRTSRFLDSGALVPAKSTVCLVRDSAVLASVRSDEQGNFQFVGLTPGVYGFIAGGEAGYTAFSVRVFAPDEDVTEDRRWLHATLIPRETIRLVNDLLAGRPPAVTCISRAPAGMGVESAERVGGRESATFVGLAGLVGLAGISGEASPASP